MTAAGKATGRTYAEMQQLLVLARTMDEISRVAGVLGLSFEEAYQERKRLFRRRFGI